MLASRIEHEFYEIDPEVRKSVLQRIFLYIYILRAASGNASYQAVLLADAATVRSVVTFVRK